MKKVKMGWTKQGKMWNIPVPGFLYRWLRLFVEIHEPVGVQDIVEIEHIRNGKVIDRRVLRGNLITNVGKAVVAARIGGVAMDEVKYLALGTGDTPADAGDDDMEAEITTGGLARAAATVSRVQTTVANDTLQLLYTWTASAGHSVTEIGAFNDASAGIMLNHKVFGVITLVSTDQIKMTVKFPITAA